jgi:hypothetical protein
MADEPENKYIPNQIGSVNPETEPKANIPGVEEKRRPGRQPKAPAVVDTRNTNYSPSPERNDLVQSVQPTGRGGVSGDAGDSGPNNLGDWDNDGQAGGDIKNQKMFPVKLLKNYRPAGYWERMTLDGERGNRPTVEKGQEGTIADRVNAGYSIYLPIDEAKDIIKKGLAVRADDLPD